MSLDVVDVERSSRGFAYLLAQCPFALLQRHVPQIRSVQPQQVEGGEQDFAAVRHQVMKTRLCRGRPVHHRVPSSRRCHSMTAIKSQTGVRAVISVQLTRAIFDVKRAGHRVFAVIIVVEWQHLDSSSIGSMAARFMFRT
jgi:hypothetical protein